MPPRKTRALGSLTPTTPSTTNARPLLETSKCFVSIHLPEVFNPSLAQPVSALTVYLGWAGLGAEPEAARKSGYWHSLGVLIDSKITVEQTGAC